MSGTEHGLSWSWAKLCIFETGHEMDYACAKPDIVWRGVASAWPSLGKGLPGNGLNYTRDSLGMDWLGKGWAWHRLGIA
jgi:hypothetical protein